MVSLGGESGSLKESLAARDARLEEIRVTVGAILDLFELLKDRLEQRVTLVEKAKGVLETRLAEPKARLDAALPVMTVHRDWLSDDVVCLLSDRSVLIVEVKTTRRQLVASGT